jgi:tellurite resistance protein
MSERTARLTDEQLETVLEVVLMVCLADGELERGELARIRERATQLEDGRLDRHRTDGLMLDAALKIQKEGRDARLARAARVLGDDEAKRIALALALEVAGADGLDDEERASAEAAARAFSIPRADLDALVARVRA